MMKNWLFAPLAALALVGLSSCDESSLVPDDFVRDERNIEAWVFSYWNGDNFNYDSVYQVTDATISIQSIELAFSDYKFSTTTADTVDADTSFGLGDLSERIFKLGLLPSGTYNGEHQITLGYDSITYFTPVADAPSEINGEPYARISNVGYNHLIIKGLYKLDEDTVGTEPYLPFEYYLAGQDFNAHFEVPMSFSVTANNPVSILFNLDVAMLFQGGLSPADRPLIFSDPQDNDDMTAATLLYDNLVQAMTLD